MNLVDIRTVETPQMGCLSFFEAGIDIPFEVKRVYYTYGAPIGTQRGGHAHKNLEQFLICPFGSIEVFLDDGVLRESVILDSPRIGVLVGSMIWHDMIWRQQDSVLMVAASDYYNEHDYIRDYEEFLAFVAEKGTE